MKLGTKINLITVFFICACNSETTSKIEISPTPNANNTGNLSVSPSSQLSIPTISPTALTQPKTIPSVSVTPAPTINPSIISQPQATPSVSVTPIQSSSPITNLTGKIVYSEGKMGYINENDNEIYSQDLNTNKIAQMTNNSFDDNNPSWSPDGKRIVFSSRRESATYNLFIMDSDGSNQKKLTDIKDWEDEYFSDWSPDGKKIVYTSKKGNFQSVYLINIDGTNKVKLTKNEFNEASPFWSPDGSKIAFTGLVESSGDSEIYIINSDGSNQKKIFSVTKTLTQSFYNLVKWLPDGSKLYFPLMPKENNNNNWGIYTINLDGSNLTNMFKSYPIFHYLSIISNDGKSIMYTSCGVTCSLNVINSDGKNNRNLITTIEHGNPIRGFDWLN